MKKVLMILAAICMTMAANAKILRVSNVSGSSAPYTTIDDALNAASAGDTIMLDSSPNYYGTINSNYNITKKIVLIGPGYWLTENGTVAEGASSAKIGHLTVKAEGVVIKGLSVNNFNIQAPKTVINRCSTNNIIFKNEADNGIITQCFITGEIVGANFTQLTNNIITSTSPNDFITDFTNGIIAYNTFRNKNIRIGSSIKNCTFENNLWKDYNEYGSGNSYNNNYKTDIINTQATNDFIDTDYYNLEIPAEVISQYGAFAGDSPYVISGVPSGPIITDLEMPTTVEVGSTPTVTIKVSISK